MSTEYLDIDGLKTFKKLYDAQIAEDIEAASANAGTSDDIEALQETVATNTTNIAALQTTVDGITAVDDDDIEGIFEE